MNKNLIQILFVAFLIFNFSAKAQIEDFQTWHSLSIDKEITKDLTFLFEQEFRIINNSTYLNDMLSVAGLEYKINKHVRISSMYRYTQAIDIELGTEHDQRFIVDLALREKIDRFTFSYRGRYQIKFANYQNKVIGDTPLQYFRNKFQTKYNVKKVKLDPYASIEFYYSLNNPMGNEIDRWRLTLGGSYDFTNNLSASLYYRYQERRVSYRTPVNINIIGTSFNYSF